MNELFWLGFAVLVGVGGIARWMLEPSEEQASARHQREFVKDLDAAIQAWKTAPPVGTGRKALLERLIRTGSRVALARREWVDALAGVLDSDHDASLRCIAAEGLRGIYAGPDVAENAPLQERAGDILVRAYRAEGDADVRAEIVASLAGYQRDITSLVVEDTSADVRLAYLEGLREETDGWAHIVGAFRGDPDPRIAEWVQEADDGSGPFR